MVTTRDRWHWLSLAPLSCSPSLVPSPADVLAAVITGLHEPGPAVVGHVATLDVTETGACGPAWVRTCVCVARDLEGGLCSGAVPSVPG